MRGFLVCGFEELPGFLTRAAIAELTGGSALMEKEYVQAEASFLVSLPPLANSHTFLEKLAALLDGS